MRLTDDDFRFVNNAYLKTSQEKKVQLIEIDTRIQHVFIIHPDLYAWSVKISFSNGR